MMINHVNLVLVRAQGLVHQALNQAQDLGHQVPLGQVLQAQGLVQAQVQVANTVNRL